MIKKRIIFFIFVILFLQCISADSIFNVQTSQFSIFPSGQQKSQCQQGQDFIIQIAPFGCSPAVVRDDLLEENDVQVYCQLGATKINPLIDVQAIDSVSFSGQYPKEVSGVGFYPAQAALGVPGDLNTPVLNNIGYVVINLKKQPNSTAIPESVSGNLTAKIKYNIKNAFGIGNAFFYLPELTNDQWEAQKTQYSFWNGKGTLKADGIGTNEAEISVYSNDQKISGVTLKKGETSNDIYLPGFECQAGLKLRLDDLQNPDTTAKLRINAEVVNVKKGESFLDNRCQITNLQPGTTQRVSMRCKEDDKTSNFDLTISPRVILKIDGVDKEVGVGDYLYPDTGTYKGQRVYLAYIGNWGGKSDVNSLFVYLISKPGTQDKLTPEEISSWGDIIGGLIESGILNSGGGLDAFNNVIKSGIGYGVAIGRWIDTGEAIEPPLSFGTERNIFGKKVSIISFANSQDMELTGIGKEYYDNAKKDYETIKESFSSEPYQETSTFGEEASYNEILLSFNANQKKTVYDLCQKFMQDYPNSKKDLSYCKDASRLSNEEIQNVFVTVNKEVKTISFDGISQPTFNDFGVTIMINTPAGRNSFDLTKDKIIYIDKNQETYFLQPSLLSTIESLNLFALYPTGIYFKFSNGAWWWSHDAISWVTFTTTNERREFISRFENKNLLDGSKILVDAGAIQKIIPSNNYLQLISATDNTATIKTNLQIIGFTQSVIQELSGGALQLTKDVQKDLGAGYSFTLTKINLKKIARVSVIPNINPTGTNANFSFTIGIEKRNINLPPEQIKQIVKTLNKTISDWQGISDHLGTAVEGLKAGCFAAGAALVIKNFISGTGGAGIARQDVMRGNGGWTEKCTTMVAQKTYVSLDKCYLENADKIDQDVAEVSKIITQQNNNIKQLESGITTSQFLTENVVNTTALMERYTPKVSQCLEGQTFVDPSGKGATISSADLSLISYNNWKDSKYFNQDQLRDIELYCDILKDNTASSELKDIANQKIYSDLLDVKTNAGNFQQLKNLASSLSVASSQVTFVEIGQNLKKYRYEGLTNGNRIAGIGANLPISIVATSDGKQYILLLNNSAGISQLPVQAVYNIDGTTTANVPPEFSKIYFERFDASSYQNPYKNPQLQYYETDPYKGLPAIVPFDLKNGWYAAMKQTLPIGGNIQSYDASARVNSFSLCNVGQNGIEEFQTIGDDNCEMINLGTGQPYNDFAYLSPSEAKSLVNKAQQAVLQASKIPEDQRKGFVSINGQRIKVGEPAADIPQFQCQDFMSPKECLLLFNLCDPVICPSSRCDLGGTYPVKDVTQTGIIGGLVLCLPNFQEGIVVPVCLTGVKAGIDGLVSILTSYRDCLQESLTSGKVMGVCDEIESVYLCDFLWKQALPLADIAIPKIAEALSGQNVRGGGEYSGVQSAWSASQSAAAFFINSYGANAKDSFIARTTETVKADVCKSFVSAVVPTGADFLDQLIQPDSPVQFTGRFDEIPLTSATVPPTSHYKVFYHIYAGQDSGAYYQVYLKGSSESSYYQGTTQNLVISSGYIAVGGSADDTKDLTGVAGYNQMCIQVNKQDPVCDFKEVSTDFALNYVKDEYLSSQASQTDIKTTANCISGSASAYSLLNPNVQSAAENIINPQIYDEGIIRICATDNPGLGTDSSAYLASGATGSVIAGITGKIVAPTTTTPQTTTPETTTPTNTIPQTTTDQKKIIENLTKNPGVTNGPRWVQVGYCDNEKVKCWLDTQSVKDVIKSTTVEGNTLDAVTQNYLDILKNQGNYLSSEQFSSAVQNIQKEKDSSNKINLIENIFDKTLLSNEKVQLLFLRGNAYMDLLITFLKNQPKPSTTTMTTVTSITLNSVRIKVLAAAATLEGKMASDSARYSCLASVDYVYKYAGVSKYNCIYSSAKGKEYNLIADDSCFYSNNNGQTVTSTKTGCSVTIETDQRNTGGSIWVSQCGIGGACGNCDKTILEKDKLDSLKPGDLIFYVWGKGTDSASGKLLGWDHAAIFIGWTDQSKHIATLFDWNGAISKGQKDKDGVTCEDKYFYPEVKEIQKCGTYRYYTADLNDNAHPVYVYQSPDPDEKISGTGTTSSNAITSTDSQIISSSSGYTPQLPTKTTVGDKILAEAVKLKDTPTGDDVRTVALVLTNAGISGFAVTSDKNTLISNLETKDFMEIGTDYLKAGDIILLGNGCTENKVGIFSNWDISNKQVVFYTEDYNTFGNFIERKESVSNIFNLNDNIYIYRAYRYVGDLSEAEKANIVKVRTKWTLLTATNQANALRGNYNDNKEFVNELIFDGILTEQDCKDVRGGFLGIGMKDMNWVKTTLLAKQASQVSGGAH